MIEELLSVFFCIMFISYSYNGKSIILASYLNVLPTHQKDCIILASRNKIYKLV